MVVVGHLTGNQTEFGRKVVVHDSHSDLGLFSFDFDIVARHYHDAVDLHSQLTHDLSSMLPPFRIKTEV